MAWIASWSEAVNGRRRSREVSSSTGPSSRSAGGRIARSALSHLFDTDPARCRKAETPEALWGAMNLMPSSIALLFPGQGSHAEGMEDPYRGHPLMERGLELLGYDPFERLSEGTRYQQPALFLCSVAAWDAWRAEPPEDDAGEAIAAAGHSLGEYAALVAAGAPPVGGPPHPLRPRGPPPAPPRRARPPRRVRPPPPPTPPPPRPPPPR